MVYPQLLFNSLLDLLFPIKCIFCGFVSEKAVYVCKRCQKLIPMRKSFECIGCNKSSALGQTCFSCRSAYSIDHLFIATDYKDKRVKKMIKLYKYQFIDTLYGPIYGLLAKYISWLSKEKHFNIFQANPLIVPVPLNYYRLNWRGFNQSELLARALSDRMQFDFAGDMLIRDKARPQAEIEEKDDRKLNIQGKFHYVGLNLNGREIILIDDVCTTGATINECAKLLKQNGAGKIYALVVARG